MLELSISDFSIEFCHTKVHDLFSTYLFIEGINKRMPTLYQFYYMENNLDLFLA